VKLGTGTIVDATLIEAPSSTKNKSGERDPEMHQTRKGKQWHFGMKAHVGVDAETRLVHTVEATAANVADSKMLPDLLRGDETTVVGRPGLSGPDRRAGRACSAGRRSHLPPLALQAPRLPEQRDANRIYSKTRSRVEHVFAVISNLIRVAIKPTSNQLSASFPARP
jgi:IS5 family transposase